MWLYITNKINYNKIDWKLVFTQKHDKMLSKYLQNGKGADNKGKRKKLAKILEYQVKFIVLCQNAPIYSMNSVDFEHQSLDK